MATSSDKNLASSQPLSPPESKPTSPISGMLTSSELASLKREMKEASAWLEKTWQEEKKAEAEAKKQKT